MNRQDCIGIIVGGVVITIFGIGILFLIPTERQTPPMDVMDERNICRPVPENDKICGESQLDYNGIDPEFTYIILANGTYIKTDCLTDVYPRFMNSTHYGCGGYQPRTYQEILFSQNQQKGM